MAHVIPKTDFLKIVEEPSPRAFWAQGRRGMGRCPISLLKFAGTSVDNAYRAYCEMMWGLEPHPARMQPSPAAFLYSF